MGGPGEETRRGSTGTTTGGMYCLPGELDRLNRARVASSPGPFPAFQ